MEILEAENRTLLKNLYVWSFVTCLWPSSSAATAAIRLAGVGSTRCSGRIEIHHAGSWGTVCDHGWDLDDAQVVCRELGCGLPMTATLSAAFGEGVGEVWLDRVACSGNESSLSQCSHGGFGSTNCQHSQDAGVVCSGVYIRLEGGTWCSGRVEVQRAGVWGTVCDTSWGLPEAQVVCRQLNCGAALEATGSASFGQGTGRIWLNDVACSGGEGSLAQCRHAGFGQHNCNHSEDAGVVCSVSLPKPTISITPVGEVTWGQEVSITCSVSIQGSVGIFILKQTFGSFKRTRISTSNSETFRVPDVDFNSAGPYQCQYQRRSLAHEFNSPLSDSVTVTVAASPLQPVTPVAFGCLLVLLVVPLLVFLFYRRRPETHKTSTNMVTTRVRDIHMDHEGQYVNVVVVKDAKRRQKEEEHYEEPLREGEHDHEEAGTCVNDTEAKSICVSGEEGDSDDGNEYENITLLLDPRTND